MDREELAKVIRNAKCCGLTVDGERVFCDDPRSECAMSCDCREAADAVLACFRDYLGRDDVVERVAETWADADGLDWIGETMSLRGHYRDTARAALGAIGGVHASVDQR